MVTTRPARRADRAPQRGSGPAFVLIADNNLRKGKGLNAKARAVWPSRQ